MVGLGTGVTCAITGGVVSKDIQVTVAVADQVLPARSLKVNTNDPFAVKVFDGAFNQVIASLNHVTVAKVFPLVRLHDVGA